MNHVTSVLLALLCNLLVKYFHIPDTRALCIWQVETLEVHTLFHFETTAYYQFNGWLFERVPPQAWGPAAERWSICMAGNIHPKDSYRLRGRGRPIVWAEHCDCSLLYLHNGITLGKFFGSHCNTHSLQVWMVDPLATLIWHLLFAYRTVRVLFWQWSNEV